nr:unnamed protein product [uncultured bacterium]
MNENIGLTKILKYCPKDTELYSSLVGEAGYKWKYETKTLEKLIETKFDPNTLKPYDKVLVRDGDFQYWRCDIFSHIEMEHSLFPYTTIGGIYSHCIPYNDDTKHLVGTTDEAPEYYRYWEE